MKHVNLEIKGFLLRMSFLKLCLVEAKIIILSDVALNASINRRSDYLYIKSEVNKGTCVELRFLHFT